MMKPPLFCTHRERHGSSTAPFARSLPLTLALIPNPSSGALHALDADDNHGSQVGPRKLPERIPKLEIHRFPPNSLCARNSVLLCTPR